MEVYIKYGARACVCRPGLCVLLTFPHTGGGGGGVAALNSCLIAQLLENIGLSNG